VQYAGMSLALHGPNPVQALILNKKDERCLKANDKDQVDRIQCALPSF
jgi:hypothetical protein